MLNFSLQVIFGENTCTIRCVYLYLCLYLYFTYIYVLITYIYTYTCHIRVPSNKNFPSVIKVVTLAFIAWKNSFIFIAAYCLLLSSIFIAYLLYQTECDGRLGNQMSVYATAWVKHKVYL